VLDAGGGILYRVTQIEGCADMMTVPSSSAAAFHCALSAGVSVSGIGSMEVPDAEQDAFLMS
jgi:hypothetical protein